MTNRCQCLMELDHHMHAFRRRCFCFRFFTRFTNEQLAPRQFSPTSSQCTLLVENTISTTKVLENLFIRDIIYMYVKHA